MERKHISFPSVHALKYILFPFLFLIDRMPPLQGYIFFANPCARSVERAQHSLLMLIFRISFVHIIQIGPDKFCPLKIMLVNFLLPTLTELWLSA